MNKNYYIQSVLKSDCSDAETGKRLAIARAKQKARLLILPCVWTAKHIGQTPTRHVFRVIRQHNKGYPLA